MKTLPAGYTCKINKYTTLESTSCCTAVIDCNGLYSKALFIMYPAPWGSSDKKTPHGFDDRPASLAREHWEAWLWPNLITNRRIAANVARASLEPRSSLAREFTVRRLTNGGSRKTAYFQTFKLDGTFVYSKFKRLICASSFSDCWRRAKTPYRIVALPPLVALPSSPRHSRKNHVVCETKQES
jgi:hypothetical protein